MQVSVESLGNLERRLTFTLPADRYESVVGGRLKEIQRGTNLKGFRKGKVPASVIEQRFGQRVQRHDPVIAPHQHRGQRQAREQQLIERAILSLRPE